MEKKLYDLTAPQKSIWLTEQFYKGTNINNVCGVFLSSIPLDYSLFEKAIKIFVQNNESFRTKLTLVDGEVKQYFDNYTDFNINIIEISSDTELEDLKNKINSKGFDLLDSPLFNFTIFKYLDGRGGFIVNANHIISDSWTSGIIANEISKIYCLLKSGQTFEKDSELSYSNYIKTEQEYINSEKFGKDKAYWDSVFETVPEIATIPSLNQTSSSDASFKAKRFYGNLNLNKLEKLKEYSAKNKVSLYNLFMGIFALYLGRVSNLDNFVIGTPILNRTNFKEKQTTGMFINVLPLKFDINHEQKFNEFISKIAKDSMGLLRHQRYSYNYILEDLRKKDSSLPGLYNVLLSYQITKMNENNDELPHHTSWVFNESTSDDLDIHIFEWNDNNSLQIAYDYRLDKYSKEEISMIHERILHVIDQILNNENILLKEIEIVTEEEKHKILYEFNNTKADYPKDKTIAELFEEQVEKTPDNIALVFEDQKLTYRELNEKANQLANYLINQKIGKNKPIAVILNRSIDLIISMLAIIKSGNIYMPISTEFPMERINYILENSKTNFIITNSEITLSTNKNLKNINIDKIKLNKRNNKNINNNINVNSGLYIIYTSGSTGSPKGVEVSHKNLNNFVHSFNLLYENISSTDKLLASTNICFDVSIFEFFISLLNGITLYLYNENTITDIFNFCETIIKNNITMLYLPPNILNNIYEILIKNNYSKLSKLLLGVEPINSNIIKKYYNLNPNLKIINAYGPTETTICATAVKVSNKLLSNYKIIPIGKPLNNLTLYILDKNYNPVPVNVPGELYIVGDNVSNGYYLDEERSKKSFIKLPFNKNIAYKTGDIVKWNEDGNISFIGRKDSQIKLNGHRIELDEIESYLYSYPNIDKCVAFVKDNKLIAYFTSSSTININDLKTYLRTKLPNYFVPNILMQLENFKLTTNGKIDKKYLENIKYNIQTEYIQPKTDSEKKLTKIFEEVLNIKKISITDNFFELGGDSLSAINLCTKIYNKFNIQISVKDILEFPIISDLSDLISSKISNTNSTSIQKIKKADYYNISSAQKNIYLASELGGENSLIYNIPGGVIFDKIPDIKKLENCFNTLIQRHESFRTFFEAEDDNIVEKILDKIDFKLDITEKSISENDLDISFKEFVKPFDLSKAPLLRAKLIKLDNKKAALFVDMHHIISDGTSLSIFIDELCKLYNNQTLDEIKFTYKDFASFENEALSSGKFEEAEKYWVNQFKDDIPVLNMPTNYSRPAIKSYEGAKVYSKIDSKTLEKINKICKENSITPYMLLLSVYYILLSKYTSQDDIVIGSPIVGRNLSDLYNIIGMFVNTLPVRAKIDSSLSFKEFLNSVKNICLENYKYQDYPLNELISKLNISRDTSRAPLFDTLFTYQNNGLSNINFDGINSKIYVPDTKVSKFDLSLEIVPENDILNLNFEYCTKLFTKQFIETFANHYKNILNAVLTNLDGQISSICMLSEEEKHKILYEFNNTKSDYPKDKTIAELFEEQVEKTPDNIALVFEDQKLTYKELNKKANQLANYLLESGVKQREVIGIFLDKSLEMIISILATLKINCTFLPIDIDYPIERIKYMINDSNCTTVLTFTEYFSKISFLPKMYDVNLNNKEIYSFKTTFNSISGKDCLAYIMYTSGSTGTPKGVMIKQKNVIRLVRNTNFIKFDKSEKIIQTGSIVFDACTFEIWGALLNGFELYLIKKDTLLNPVTLEKYLINNKITIMWLTAPLFNQLSEYNPNMFNSLKYLLTGGDVLSPKHINMVRNVCPNLNIINGYGPTENTTFSTCFNINKNYTNSIPIGFPISNSTCYVVSKDLNLLPIGIPGELVVGGDGVCQGYLNKPELSKEKFINNTFTNNDTLYKTGDLVKWNKDGSIEFIGRIDNQVKIRGFRIELNEITLKIQEFPNIKEAITIIQNIGQEKVIYSYFSSDKMIDSCLIKKFLKTHLPPYSIPTHIIQLDKLPLNANGKIDRKALPILNENKSKDIVKPRNDFDSFLTQTLSSLLNIDISKISIHDNFFELGGDSLNAINLSAKIHSKFNVEIFVKDILEFPIISDLSDLIASKISNTSSISIPKVKKADFYNISSAQKNMYIASELGGENSLIYNIPGGVIFDKMPDIKKLENCFNTLIQRHESFRTYFETEDENIVQKILDKIDFKLDISKKSISENDLDISFKEFVKPFDLSKAPLIRSKLIKLDNKKAALFVDMHHIISDGTSLSIFIDELCKLYNNQTLDEIKFTYKDFASFENEALSSDKFEEAEKYWVNQFKDDIPVLNMPTNYSRPAIKSYEGAKIYSKIDSKTLEKINKTCKENSITPYMLLLSVYYILLSKYTSQDDIVVGSPIVGRNFSELYNIIGMFVNTLPVRAKIDSSLSFKEFLNSVKNICLENYKYQDYPLNELISKLNISRDTSRAPLFDTLFTYQNNGLSNINFDGINSKIYVPDTKVSKFDLSLEIVPENDILNLNFEYCTKLFTKQFIETFANHYKNILNVVLNNLNVKISSICMLSGNELNKIIYEFNNTKIDYPKNKTISELFEEQVRKTPDNIALVFEDKKLTYRQLNEKANGLAAFLRKNDIGRQDIVGIMVNRSLEMIVSILAVLKAGGTYIPIDPEYPEDRINYMLNNSKAKLLLTFEKLKNKVSFENKIFVELNNKKIYSPNKNNLENINKPEDSCYIIYTSGSTGLPKGVVLKHSNITNFIFGVINKIPFNKKDIMVSITTISFDIFILESLLPLLNGMKIIIASEKAQTDISLLNELCLKNNVNIIQTTPSRMLSYTSDTNISKFLKNIKYFLVGGEPFSPVLLNNLHKFTNAKIFNMYGPTETAVWSSIKDLSTTNKITIGNPISNTQMYILDKNLLPVPIGVPGELYISGNGVCDGYYNNIDLNRKSFINNPFIPNTLMYKTGDLCRLLASGEIEYLERIDNQVKIRGLRIELGEIENKINEFPNIKKACVIKQTINNRDFISAYFTVNKRVNTSELRKYLSNYLPRYMVPSYFTILEKFPYTPNGKIDKKALPLPKEILSNSEEQYIKPTTNLQIKLVNIFEDILNIKPIGINDNFFELGGDSILAMNLNIELKKLTDKISYSDIFKFSTVKKLEDKINSLDENYDFEYMKKNYDKYAELLNKNLKIPKLYDLKYKKAGNILLTGSTGFLGIHILDSFIKKEKGNIYCIIRNETGLNSNIKLQQKLHYYFGNKYDKLIGKRIFAITGDITSPGFGLNQEELLNLANNIDIVINSAAKVSHFGNYSDFYNTNVKSVKYMLDFCRSFNKKFYQISTLSVSGNALETASIKQNIEKETLFKENNLYIGQSLENVYVRSKFEAECLVLDSVLDGTDAYILRVGNLMPRYKDGLFQENISENAYINRLLGFIKIGAIPESLKDIYLEFTPIDITANSIINLITHPNKNNRIFHLFNNNHVYLNTISKYLKNLNKNFKILDDKDFKKKIKKLLNSSNEKEILNSLINDFDKDLQLNYFTDIIIKSDTTIKYLQKINFRWPKISKRYLNNFINLLRMVL